MKTRFLSSVPQNAALVIAILLHLSCSKQPSDFGPYPQKSNLQALGEPFRADHISIGITPPKEWSQLDSLEVVQFQKLLEATELKRKFRETAVQNVFLDLGSSSMLYIAELTQDSFPMPAVAAQYHEFLKARPGIKELKTAKYLIGEQPVYYFMVESLTTINYKLLGESSTGNRFLIEFVIGAEAHNKVKAAVESSIATLKRL